MMKSIAAAAFSAVVAAQQLPPLPADPNGGQIVGVVVDAASGRPIPDVTVSLGRQPRQTDRQTLTGALGEFAFDGVPAGRYVVTPSKAGLIVPRWTPGQPARTVAVRPGGEVHRVLVQLQPGAAIEGVVKNDAGMPLPGARITALACNEDGLDCVRSRLPGAAVESDHRGSYRLFGLQPGIYVVAADARLTSSAGPVHRASTADIVSAEQMLSGQTAKQGQRSDAGEKAVTYVTSFAPGTVRSSDAQRVHASAAGEIPGVDVALQIGAASSIEGSVQAADGSVPRIESLSFFQDESLTAPPPSTTVLVSPAGTFRTMGVPPGAYRLSVRLAGADGTASWAERRFVLDGSDIQDASLVLASMPTVSGRIVVEGSMPNPKMIVPRMRLDMRRTDVKIVVGSLDSATTTSGADGQFRIPDVAPGTYSFAGTVADQKAGVWLRSLRSTDGRELLDLPLVVSAEDPKSRENLEAVLSTTVSRVAGSLTNAAGAAEPEYLIVAFPVDPVLRNVARRVQTAVVAADGSFEFIGLPEGEYFLGALGTADPSDVDRSLLTAMADQAQRVTVEWGKTTTASLKKS